MGNEALLVNVTLDLPSSSPTDKADAEASEIHKVVEQFCHKS